MPSPKPGLLPSQAAFRVVQNPSKPRPDDYDKVEQAIILIPEKPAAALWKQLPDGARLHARANKRQLDGKLLRGQLPAGDTDILIGRLPDSGDGTSLPDAFSTLSYAGKLAGAALANNPETIAITAAGFKPRQRERLLKALLLALAAHQFELPTLKSKNAEPSRLQRVYLFEAGKKLNLKRTLAEAESLNLARWLTALPPNVLDAGSYRKAIGKLAAEHGWQMDFYTEKKLQTAGAGAFLAVAQGNAGRDAGIVRLRYRPRAKSARPVVALVGKGIIFDTGGTNLKPFKGMLDMHTDMAGSAVALATLLTLTKLRASCAVDCWLAITENRIGNTAYKSRDVVTAANGITIEVIHTDAEGRMALADTLALAGKQKPEVIVDFATLTGSCVVALTDRYTGVMTNRAQLNTLLTDTGRACGERVWPFPMDKDFDDELKSSVADVLQCAAAGGGDHIQAARFLQRFVPEDSAWIHLDLSAETRKGGLAQVPTEITGFGVRFATDLIVNHLDRLRQAAGN